MKKTFLLLTILLITLVISGCSSNNSSNSSNSNNSYSCSCSSNIYNCSDFSTHREAQTCYRDCGGVNNDIHKLDRDGDGSACETLP